MQHGMEGQQVMSPLLPEGCLVPGHSLRILGCQGNFKHCTHLTPTREKFLLFFATLGREEEKPSLALPPSSGPGDKVGGCAVTVPTECLRRCFYSPQGELMEPRKGLRATHPTKYTH